MDQSDRLHALDAVRGFALLLGVALHGAAAYVLDFPGWVVRDTPSAALGVMFWAIHIFRMTLFFFIAGFFARLALERKGSARFVRDRLMRVGVPLVAGWFVLMPAMGVAFAVAAWTGVAAPPAADQLAATPAGSILAAIATQFPWGHLWFLYMLLGFYVLALIGRAGMHLADRAGALRRAVDAIVAAIVRSHIAPLVLGAPLLALFLGNPEWRMWFGVPSPIAGLVPDATSSTAFAVAFLFGWAVHRQAPLIRVWERHWALYGSLAIATTLACLAIAGPRPVYTPAVPGTATTIYALLYVVAIWTWVFGAVGLSLRFFSGFNAIRRYVADASYWTYLAHVPPVMALHVALAPLAWRPEIKFLITVAVTTLLCMATYQLFVRRTFIGVVLNGRRGGTLVREPVVAASV